MSYITLIDYFLLLIYLFFLYFIIKVKAIKYKGTDLYKYFLLGFFIHMLGSVLYAMVVQYYYGYGDSFGFYQGGQVIRKMAESGNPLSTFFLNPADAAKLYKVSGGDDIYMEAGLTSTASVLIYKITALLSYISFNSYLVISLFFGLFSFAGIWELFKVFNELQNKKNEKWLAYSVLFLPSICFWGSGLMKDSLCLGLVGYITTALYQFFYKGSYKIKYIFVLLLSFYFLYTIKSYIALSLIIAVALTYVKGLISKSKGNIIKLSFILFILFVTTLFLSYTISASITSMVEDSKTQIENFKNSYQSNSEADENSLAGFKEADFDFTITGAILRIPLKVTTTLFRPFVWETRKPIMMFSALESLLMLIVALYIIIKCKIIGFFRYIFLKPELFFSFIFILLMSIIIGFTTFNFGTLVRYKLPILPFYFFLFTTIYLEYNNKRLSRITAE